MPTLPFRKLVTLLVAVPSTALADGGSVLSPLAGIAGRAALSLAGVLALIAALAFLFRRLQRHAEGRPAAGRLASRARLDLGQRREVRIVEADGRALLLGVTPGAVSLLAELGGAATAGNTRRTEEEALRVVPGWTTSSRPEAGH